MKKIIRLGLVSLIGTFLFVACSDSSPQTNAHSKTTHNQHMTQEKMHDIIKETCEANSWKVTEFKLNTLIAEESNGDNMKSVTIIFDKDTFSIEPANSKLSDLIKAAL